MGWGQQHAVPRRRADAARAAEAACSTSSATSTRSRTCCATRPSPAQLAEVDLDQVRELLGDDAARCLDQLAELAKELEEAGLIEQREGRMELTPEGHPRASASGRSATCSEAAPGPPGRHEIERSGARPRAGRRAQALRVRRPVPPRRRAHGPQRDHAPGRGHAGAHPSRRLRDRAHRAAHAQRHGADARRVALDGDARRFLAAKKVAMALHALISIAVPPRLPRHGQLRRRRAAR